MIDLISSIFSEGDYIKIFFNNSNKCVEGCIFKILPSSIAIKNIEGKICGVKGDDIDSFEEGTTEVGPAKESILHAHSEVIPIDISPKTDVNVSAADMPNTALIDSGAHVTEGSTLIKKNSQEKTNQTDQEQIDETKFGTQKFKPGDIIPMDKLHKIDPKLKNKSKLTSSQKKTSGKMSTLGHNFDALDELVKDKHELDDLKLVHALGEIKFVKPEKNYGFILDWKTGKDIYFSLNQIIEKGYSSASWFHMNVLYSIQNDPQGPKAISIHKPKTIKEMITLAKELSNADEYKHAFHIVEQILSEYPDNYSADNLKRQLAKLYPQYNSKPKEYSNAYSKAKKYSTEKAYDKAIEFYYKALDNNEKVESTVKDLGMLYAQLSKSTDDEKRACEYRQKAIKFMDEYVEELSDNISTLYYLENFYYSVKDYDNFINTVDKLVEEKDFAIDKNKHAILLAKKAVALMQQNSTYEAEEAIDEALSWDPSNIAALRIKNIIENNPDSEDLKSEISATEFYSLNSGISDFIQQTLDNYKEYAGVPPKIIESGIFNEVTLNEIRKVIETAGKARPRERAKYLLTEGKLLTDIEPGNTSRLRSVMARYCNAMSLNHISDYSNNDITRFYYNEAFSLEENYRKNATQVALYLMTHCCTYSELINMTTKSPSVDDALDRIISSEFDQKKWESILSMFLYNREISAQISSKLYNNEHFRTQSLIALEHFGLKTLNPISKENFVEAWNKARDIRIRDYKKVVTQIKAIGKSSTLEEITIQLLSLRDIEQEWMPSLDTSRINNIINNIVPALQTYIKSSGYRNKEANKNNANCQVQQLIEEITDGPTKLSFESLLPLLKRINQLVVISFNEIIKMSAPKIGVKLLSFETVINEGNEVSIQIAISNHKDSSPIKEVSVDIESTENISTIEGSEVSYNAIDGGESQIFKLKIKVGKEIIKQKAAALNVKCRYKTGNEKEECSSLQTLRLYSPEDYCPIENPYAPIADGGPVPVDSEMFYGREEFITNIVDAIVKSPSKQIIIYGQKRCGKSSVMLHLKKKLLETGKTFCIFFSIGEIINNLTEASFYYKILSTIETDLEFAELDGFCTQVPVFSLPSLAEFKLEDEDNPLNTFTKYMVKFKLACKKTSGWEDKNLVVMIDEFTYLYTEIKKGNISPSIMKQWKAVTQNEHAQFSVVLVGQDVVPSFKKEDYARNAFGVIQDIRLTYLKDAPARDLIEKPILDENGNSRYIDDAVTKIIEYTSKNPYYIQIFCARLVDYMNANKSISVTEADVIDVANSFVYGSEALGEDKFDNLIRAGETEDLQEYPESEILQVLKQVSLNSKIIGFCNRNDINALQDKEREDAILKHLVDREVLELRGENNYKIQVKLFQEWLLNH